jgi:hypothetical protein
MNTLKIIFVPKCSIWFDESSNVILNHTLITLSLLVPLHVLTLRGSAYKVWMLGTQLMLALSRVNK